jgi:hypothetical protein
VCVGAFSTDFELRIYSAECFDLEMGGLFSVKEHFVLCSAEEWGKSGYRVTTHHFII